MLPGKTIKKGDVTALRSANHRAVLAMPKTVPMSLSNKVKPDTFIMPLTKYAGIKNINWTNKKTEKNPMAPKAKSTILLKLITPRASCSMMAGVSIILLKYLSIASLDFKRLTAWSL